MDKKCSNLDTPLWQLSTGEFLQLLKDCLNEKSPKNNNTVATKVEEPWVYGIDGIANILGWGVGLVCTVVGVVWSLIIIALAWLFYRPLIGIILLAIAGFLIWVFAFKGKDKLKELAARAKAKKSEAI